MSRRSRYKRPTNAKAQLREATRVVVVAERERATDDPHAGVISMRLFALSATSTGEKVRGRRPWHWNPTGRDPEVFVHGDGWTTAHAGTVDNVREPDELRHARAAGLTDEERAVFLLQAEQPPRTHMQIAEALGITRRQVERRVASGNRKVVAYAVLMRNMGGGR